MNPRAMIIVMGIIASGLATIYHGIYPMRLSAFAKKSVKVVSSSAVLSVLRFWMVFLFMLFLFLRVVLLSNISIGYRYDMVIMVPIVVW